MEFFVIRHNPTGHFLPTHDGKPRTVRGGYTNDDPEPMENLPPRLFKDERSAKCALTWWLKGRIWVRRVGGGMWEEYSEEWCHEECADRRHEDMEIVKVELSIQDAIPYNKKRG